MKFHPLIGVICLSVAPLTPALALDGNGNQLSDVWEMIFQAQGLSAGADTDGDGWTNAAESIAGTNPRDGISTARLRMQILTPTSGQLEWSGLAGKQYTLSMKPNLSSATWIPFGSVVVGNGGLAQVPFTFNGATTGFFRLSVADFDTDGDGVNDWEERAIGFDPTRVQTDRYSQTDSQRVTAGLSAANTITVAVYDDTCAERWPDPAVLVLRRSGGLQPLTVNVQLTGTATRGSDYSVPFAGNTVSFSPGQREVFVEVTPISDSQDSEATETVTLTVLAGTGYVVGSPGNGSVSIINQTATSLPSAKEAARFLIQAAFGPDQDDAGDSDQIPENVEEVMQLGYSAWIDDQFTRPIGKLQPFVEWALSQPPSAEIYIDTKKCSWWNRVMGVPKLRPDNTGTQLPDILRQRVGFALSEILVISDRMEDIGVDPTGMSNYYDLLLTHAFGNYRDLLFNVSLHPCMGMYLSHLGNRKPDLVNNVHPDENYAREIMQLFSIGLWQLNPDGTRQLNGQGQPIPTYSNADITELARVFTGLAFGGTNQNFGLWPRDFTVPMKAWDAEHDCNPKSLLGGLSLPARTPSPGNTGTATMADVNAAVDYLFNHPNVGPFVARLLIQRLVTSNPSPAYIGRVSAAFANNGQGVRGDMKAVIKAILLDSEARDGAKLSDPTFGKLREPFLKCVNFARAFNAASNEGWYYLGAFDLDHVQEPMNSPSVFNFFLPGYSPPGILTQSGLVAPEFQIINATSGVTAPNYFWGAILDGLHRWGSANPNRTVKLNLTQERALNVADPDPLIRRLDLALTGGTLTPRNFQVIRESLQRISPSVGDDRLRLAIYLILTSPEFAVQQ
jgi:uncharacterized protein (DUF1800 family)